MPTKQALLYHKLKEKGGEGTSLEMRDLLDESPQAINDLAYNLKRRGMIKIVKVRIDYAPYWINKFVIIPRKQKWQ
jgi:hypothetical protein